MGLALKYLTFDWLSLYYTLSLCPLPGQFSISYDISISSIDHTDACLDTFNYGIILCRFQTNLLPYANSPSFPSSHVLMSIQNSEIERFPENCLKIISGVSNLQVNPKTSSLCHSDIFNPYFFQNTLILICLGYNFISCSFCISLAFIGRYLLSFQDTPLCTPISISCFCSVFNLGLFYNMLVVGGGFIFPLTSYENSSFQPTLDSAFYSMDWW